MNDSFTDNLFKRNGFGPSELTAQRINTIMEQTIAYPKFKKYAHVMETADYLVTLSLANNSLDADLSQIHQNIQKLL
jgi:multiple sugar transport system substrate-binding protein